MKIINKIYILGLVVLTIVSCTVDDYTDALAPRPLNAPAGFPDDPVVDYASGSVIETDTNDDMWIYMESGGSVVFNIEVIAAPGMMDSVSVSLSNSVQPEDLGTVTNVTFPDGQESGTISVTYVAGNVPGDEDISITVWDAQEPRKSQTYASYLTMRINECHANNNLLGDYATVSNGFDGVAGADYTDLRDTVSVYLRGDNHPGYVRFSDGSFGLYTVQGYSGDFINVEICDGDVLGASESGGVASDFTYSGTLNADGSMNITWSNIYGDTGTTVMTPL